ncbi:hypothetical protein M5E87_00930 [Flavonifractor plautii]|nr:hypothetical protein M5E87_00930 [Flavonifractor plautii]
MMLTFIGVFLALRAFDSVNTVGVLRGGGDVRAATIIDTTPLWFVSLPPGRPVRPGVPVGHLLGLCGHHGRAIRQVRHWPVPPPLPGVDQRRHPVLPYGVTAL